MIMDVVRPDSGKITIFNGPHQHAELRQEIGFVYDNLYLYEDFTIKGQSIYC